MEEPLLPLLRGEGAYRDGILKKNKEKEAIKSRKKKWKEDVKNEDYVG